MANEETFNDFDSIYDATYSDVEKYVICKCSKIDDVADIIQNIYIAVFKALKKNSINRYYVLGIAKNKVNDYYRFKFKDKIVSRYEEDILENIPDDMNLEKSMMYKYDIDKVWDYLKMKNIIVFKVFYLYYKVELKIKDIAIELDISESNVKHYLYRTLSELNKYLESEV